MPEAPAAPPPAAPAAPVTPPKGSPPPSQTGSPPERPESDWMGDVAGEIDDIDRGVERPKKEDRRAETSSEHEEDLEVTAPEDPNKGKPAGQKPSQAVPPKPGKPLTVPELRKTYEALEKKVRTEYEPETARLKARVQELEQGAPAELKPTQEKLAAAERRIAELEQAQTVHSYAQSKEFQEKYQQPYRKAWAEALADLAEIPVEEKDGTTRPANEKDLLDLANLSLGEARKQANAKFGDSADDVMRHYHEVRRLARAQQTSLEEATKNAGQASERQKAEHATAQATRIREFEQANQDLSTKYPRWFGRDEADPEGNALLDRGFALADVLFKYNSAATMVPEALLPFLPKGIADELRANKGHFTPQGQRRYHALLRNKIASFDRIARRLNTATARIAKLEESLSQYEASAPPAGGAAPRPAAGDNFGSMDDANAEIDALDKVGR